MAGCDAALIALGDMPLIGPDLIAALVADHRSLPDGLCRITLPVHAGQRGNPVIWGRAFFDDLGHISGDRGGRQIMAAHLTAMNYLPWDNDDIHRDIDTNDAFDRLLQRNNDDQA